VLADIEDVNIYTQKYKSLYLKIGLSF